MNNIILETDSYKLTHWKQYEPGTTQVVSYFESRGGAFDETVFFGLQYLIKRHLVGQVVTQEKIDYAQGRIDAHLGAGMFNRAGWQHILEAHGGRLPLQIDAVPEGTVVGTHNVLMTVENTCPECFWLTNYVETLLVQTWYPVTVATQSREMKKVLLKFLEETGDPKLIDFKLHDFGYRGVSSVETAGIGGAAHLVNFRGTDTFEALELCKEFYGENMAGFSIPASEHSTITSWGRENEDLAMQNMLESYPVGPVACVSDSFDIFAACSDIWGGTLKEAVLSRDGVLVVRPDSGDPLTVLPQVLSILRNRFGTVLNGKGYHVLDPHVRVIQGDGVNLQSMTNILEVLKEEKWSADNIAFGSGGALLQKLDRDTLKFAFKCCAVVVNGEEREVYKQPVGEPFKKSKRGRLKLVKFFAEGGGKPLYQTTGLDSPLPNALYPVFLNGDLVSDQPFDVIRARASAGL